jgi:hypothetical protein
VPKSVSLCPIVFECVTVQFRRGSVIQNVALVGSENRICYWWNQSLLLSRFLRSFCWSRFWNRVLLCLGTLHFELVILSGGVDRRKRNTLSFTSAACDSIQTLTLISAWFITHTHTHTHTHKHKILNFTWPKAFWGFKRVSTAREREDVLTSDFHA